MLMLTVFEALYTVFRYFLIVWSKYDRSYSEILTLFLLFLLFLFFCILKGRHNDDINKHYTSYYITSYLKIFEIRILMILSVLLLAEISGLNKIFTLNTELIEVVCSKLVQSSVIC